MVVRELLYHPDLWMLIKYFNRVGSWIILVLMAAAVWAQDPFPTRIPDKIAICYENQTISNRFKRMPQSIDSLVAIIRKVEAHPDTALWSIGKMASTLIHRSNFWIIQFFTFLSFNHLMCRVNHKQIPIWWNNWCSKCRSRGAAHHQREGGKRQIPHAVASHSRLGFWLSRVFTNLRRESKFRP